MYCHEVDYEIIGGFMNKIFSAGKRMLTGEGSILGGIGDMLDGK